MTVHEDSNRARPSAVSRRRLMSGLAVGGAVAGASAAFAPAAAADPSARPANTYHVEQSGNSAPDQTAIQDALDAAGADGGGHVTVGAGTWHVDQHLRIHANTRLTLTPATILIRTGEISAMLSNGPRDGSDTTTAGYDGPGNIIVEGGIWDANAPNNDRPCWGIVFGHARDITVRDLEIRDVPEWHAIEYNAIYNGLVENCRLMRGTERANGPWNAEAVSLDLAYPGLPPFGAEDYTTCEMIRIVGNHCEGWPTFAGCHSGYGGVWHSQFVIAGNTMTDLSYWGVSLRNASRCVVTGNTMFRVGGGIWLRPTTLPELQSTTSTVIADNVIDTTTRSDGIRLLGQRENGEDGQLYCAAVTGNIVRRAAANGVVVQAAPEVHVSDNSVYVADGVGVDIRDSDLAIVANNYVRDTQNEGVLVTDGTRPQLTSNTVVNAGLGDPANTAAVRFVDVDTAKIQGTTVTTRGGASKPSVAIASNSGSSGVAYLNNDVRDGYANQPFDMQGSGHVDQPGNIS